MSETIGDLVLDYLENLTEQAIGIGLKCSFPKNFFNLPLFQQRLFLFQVRERIILSGHSPLEYPPLVGIFLIGGPRPEPYG